MSFLQCPKKLWLERFRPELAEADPSRQAVFAMGHEVGAMARRLYDTGDGILIGHDTDLAAAIDQTRAELASGSSRPVFEATLERDRLLARGDVLVRDGTTRRLVEVKATTSVKAEHVADCAIQSWVFEDVLGHPTRVALAHIDNTFVYQGDGDFTGLLREDDISEDVAAQRAEVPEWLEAARRILDGPEPEARIGTRCRKPYDCPFQGHCWKATPHPLRGLPRLGARLDELLAAGYRDVRELPEAQLQTQDQARVWRAVQTGQATLSGEARRTLSRLPYPRYYLDFETINFAVPRWRGTRPYQQIPFQWSLHIEGRSGELESRAHLDLSGDHPARALAEALLDAIGPVGPVFMYTSFERTCLRTLAASCPDLATGLAAIEARLVDLHPIAKSSYYHPDMHGSWSIKAILPTIAPELDYAALDGVADGVAAQQAYAEASAEGTLPERREDLRTALLEYCKMDTLAMVCTAWYLEHR